MFYTNPYQLTYLCTNLVKIRYRNEQGYTHRWKSWAGDLSSLNMQIKNDQLNSTFHTLLRLLYIFCITSYCENVLQYFSYEPIHCIHWYCMGILL